SSRNLSASAATRPRRQRPQTLADPSPSVSELEAESLKHQADTLLRAVVETGANPGSDDYHLIESALRLASDAHGGRAGQAASRRYAENPPGPPYLEHCLSTARLLTGWLAYHVPTSESAALSAPEAPKDRSRAARPDLSFDPPGGDLDPTPFELIAAAI